jgi:hypothetical protein
MADLNLIIDPVGHRELQAASMREAQRSHILNRQVDQDMHIFVIPEPDDGWWCDHCDAAIDLEDGPILSVNNAALCHHCAPAHLDGVPRTDDETSVILPVCSCAACTPARHAALNPEGES